MSASLDSTTVDARADGAVGTAAQELGELCVLLKLGEIVLKGSNRHLFERRLQNNIRAAAKGLPEFRLSQRKGIIMLRMPGASDLEVAQLAERMRNVMGIVWVHLVRRVAKDVDTVTQVAVQAMADRSGSFAVRARRRDKRFPMISSELAGHVGAAIKRATPPDRQPLPARPHGPDRGRQRRGVRLHRRHPRPGRPPGRHEWTRPGPAVRRDRLPGRGYRMMRRGLRLDFLHFSGMPFTGPESIYKAYSLVRQLDRFQNGSRLYVVPFGKAQQQLRNSGAERLQIVAQRRLMLKTAEALADRLNASALVTGDALGQVSSQTLANITALDDAVDLPILRPLIGMDKTEIMDQARAIGTLTISELPDEDCCTMLTPRQVETAAKIADLRQIEKRLDVEELAEHLASNVQLHRPSFLGEEENTAA